MDPNRQPYKVIKSGVTTTQLAAEGGAKLVVAALRRSLGARPIQEAVRLFRQLMGLRDVRRQPGESMRKWTSRFEAFIKKTGKALHQADAEIDETTFLYPLIQGILLLECSNLSPAENAAVLATSGATSKEGGSIGNSYLYVDLAASFIAQWDDEALIRRDKNPQRRTHHTAAAATATWDPSSPARAYLEEGTVDGGEWETALGAHGEPWEDQSWEEPEEVEALDDDWAEELPPEDMELEDQFGSLEAAEAYAVTEFKNASSDMKNRHTNVHGGQGSGLSGKASERLLPCGWCGCFRWLTNYNTERITTDWRRERYGHWHEQPGRKRTWSWIRKGEDP